MLLDEAKRTLAKAGYKMEKMSEKEALTESFRNFKHKTRLMENGIEANGDDDEYYEGNAEGAGIAFPEEDDDMECPVCVICGQEVCDGSGEYNEDGDFVCDDCAANTEAPMEELDPMSIYEVPDRRTPRARQLDDMADDFEDSDNYNESTQIDECGDGSCCNGGLCDDDYIDPDTTLDDENLCPVCGKPMSDEFMVTDDNGNEYCSEECYRNAVQSYEDRLLDQQEDDAFEGVDFDESCCGCCGGKKSKKKAKKGKSNKGWVPYWQWKKNKDEE